MFCMKCGNQLPDDAQFCNHCGNAVKEHSQMPLPSINKNETENKAQESLSAKIILKTEKKGSILLWVAVACMLLLMLLHIATRLSYILHGQMWSILYLLPPILFLIIARLYGKKKPMLYAIPLGCFAALDSRLFLSELFAIRVLYAPHYIQAYVALSILPTILTILFCLTMAGKIRNKIPLLIASSVSIFLNIITGQYITRIWHDSFNIPFSVFIIQALYFTTIILLAIGMEAALPKPKRSKQGVMHSFEGEDIAAADVDPSYQRYPHPYHRLGGWLGFAAYAPLVAIGLMAIVFVVSLFSVFQYIQYLGALSVILLLVEFAGYTVLCFFCIKFSTMLIHRNPRFLRFYELTMITLCSIYLVVIVISGFHIAQESLGSILSGILGFVIWTTYFRKSVRVRTYMGSDAYLKHSIFFKNTQAPMPADTQPYGNYE